MNRPQLHNFAAIISALLLALSLSVAVEAYVAAPTSFSRQRQVSKSYIGFASTSTTSLRNSANNYSFDVNNNNAPLNEYSTVPASGSRRDFLNQSGSGAALAIIASTFLNTSGNTAAHAALLSSSSSSIPPLNTRAPDFELLNSRNGQLITLSNLLKTNKWTVLYFYPGAFTSGCTIEARNFQTDSSEYTKLNTQIVGVSVDSVEKNSEFCTAEQLDYTLLTDEDGKISKLYGSSLSIPGLGTFSNRQTYIIDPMGLVRWVFTDVESNIPGHSGDVLDKLRELQKE